MKSIETRPGRIAKTALAALSLSACGASLSIFAMPETALAAPADPTEGGKGGRIIKVTTLGKDGPGSFAEALAANGSPDHRFRSWRRDQYGARDALDHPGR